MTRKLLLHSLLPTALLLLAPAANADELVLEDGKVVVGKTKKVGQTYVVKTLDGTVRIRASKVKRIRTEAELRAALQTFAMRSGAGSSHAQLELAKMARNWGLYDEMWRYLNKVFRSSKNASVMQRRAREFMAGLEREVLPKKWRKAPTATKVRELLYRVKRRVPRAKLAAVEELLIQVPDADKDLRRRARRVTSANQRVASVRALARRPQEGNDRFVYRTAVLDSSPDVRREAMRVTDQIGKAKAAIRYLSPGLVQNNANRRIRTAEAFSTLGDVAALPLLVAAGPTAGLIRREGLPGGATRAHMAVVEQRAYIRDFDVEVAQASFIADPKVDVLHSGTVLDVTVISVTTHRYEIVRAYRKAIKKIAGSDPGADPKNWAAWLDRYQLAEKGRNQAPITPRKG